MKHVPTHRHLVRRRSPLSCKLRGFCPSRLGRMADAAVHLRILVNCMELLPRACDTHCQHRRPRPRPDPKLLAFLVPSKDTVEQMTMPTHQVCTQV